MKNIHQLLTTLRGPARFYFVRHGESVGNTKGKMQGHLDSPLTETGRAQARRTGRWFADNGITVDRVFTSPLLRATETADIIARCGDYPLPEPLESAIELHTGIFTDLSFQEIQEKYPAEYAEFVARSWESVPEAESIASLITRSLTTWETMVDAVNSLLDTPESGESPRAPGTPENPAGAPRADTPTVLTVTHGGMLQWLLKVNFGATLAAPPPWMPLILISNAAVFAFNARPVRSHDRQNRPLSWYYGQWSLMNFIPGSAANAAVDAPEQFHTDNQRLR